MEPATENEKYVDRKKGTAKILLKNEIKINGQITDKYYRISAINVKNIQVAFFLFRTYSWWTAIFTRSVDLYTQLIRAWSLLSRYVISIFICISRSQLFWTTCKNLRRL